MRDGLADGKALDALRAPLRADLVARHSPHFFGVGLEEGEIELASKAVDEELLQVLHLADRKHHGAQIADADAHGTGRPQIGQRRLAELDRIVEELAQEVDARLASAHQHDIVFLLRLAGRLLRQLFQPPVHDAVALGKEAVAADIHAVALVLHGARDAAHVVKALDDDRMDVRPGKQFVRRRQARRPSANDDGNAFRQWSFHSI